MKLYNKKNISSQYHIRITFHNKIHHFYNLKVLLKQFIESYQTSSLFNIYRKVNLIIGLISHILDFTLIKLKKLAFLSV